MKTVRLPSSKLHPYPAPADNDDVQAAIAQYLCQANQMDDVQFVGIVDISRSEEISFPCNGSGGILGPVRYVRAEPWLLEWCGDIWRVWSAVDKPMSRVLFAFRKEVMP